MKRLFIPITAVLVTVLLIQTITGADITQGHIFVPNETGIDHTDMNEIAGAAVINTDFYTAKSSATPVAADVFLFYSVANTAYRKTTLGTAVLQNPVLITGQTEDSSPANNDFFLTYDTSAGSLKKVAFQNALSGGSTNLFANFPTVTTPQLTSVIPLSQGSTNAGVTVSNLLYMALTNTVQTYSNEFDVYTLAGLGGTQPMINAAHGLSNTPQMLQVWLRCITNEHGFSVGDKLDMASLGGYLEVSGVPAGAVFGANSTNIWLVQKFALNTFTKTNVLVVTNLTFSRWRYEIQAKYFPK